MSLNATSNTAYASTNNATTITNSDYLWNTATDNTTSNLWTTTNSVPNAWTTILD